MSSGSLAWASSSVIVVMAHPFERTSDGSRPGPVEDARLDPGDGVEAVGWLGRSPRRPGLPTSRSPGHPAPATRPPGPPALPAIPARYLISRLPKDQTVNT